MIGQNIGKAVFSALFLTFAAFGGVEAGDRDHDRDHGRHDNRGDRHHDRHDRRDNHRDHRDYRGGRDVVVIDRGARGVISNYYGGYYRDMRDCPRGYAVRHGVCRPRGWAKQRYVIGEPLPRYVVVQPMPTMLVRELPQAPMGYGYRYVDGDVLLVANATHRVVDAVVAVNAAMNGMR
ncbi:DUF1236 domain-containing protein [Govanella unica]|uniref:RcnB family protein n=1 Tax=Govanella unica TaxID=2975056 RepID=A0A9X3TXD6_9PROT|nr:DUF1236 domain-containing protein [Govania unica]MDA5193498.1 RcnB family protein [Govania unica]